MKALTTQAVIEGCYRNSKGQYTNDPRPEMRTGEFMKCSVCGREKYFINTKLNRKIFFCGRRCYWNSMKRKPNSKTGKKVTEQGRINIGLAAKSKRVGSENGIWKGESVGYGALHDWVKRWRGKADKCMVNDPTCKGRFEWANISHEYKRDLNDWMSLCKSHHTRYDMGRGNK